MDDKTIITRNEIDLIISKLEIVKRAGYGSLFLKIQDGYIVYISQEIGEQVKIRQK